MHSEGGAEGLILERGVSKSLPHYPVQTKRKGISPIRASCEEGNVMKQPRVKSPNKCPMPKQNADGSDRTGKRLFHVAGEEVAGPGRRWRSSEKERANESWIKDLAEKASPGKTRYHMELVREAAEVEKEVEEFYKGNNSRRPIPQKSPSSRSVENGESQRSQRLENGGETQRSQRGVESGVETLRSQRDASRPPFIASGTIGYKKVLAVPPLISRTAPRPSSEPALEKTSSVRESLKTKGLDLEYLHADEHVSPLRRPSSGINNNGMETSRSWSGPLRPHSGPVKGSKTVKCAEHSNDGSGLLNDPAAKRDSASPKNRNKEMRSRFETWNGSANGSELIFEIGKPKEENAKKGKVQEPKLRHKAVWKSYMDEKKQNSRKSLETPPMAKSEPSSPPARVERVISSRAKRQTDQQQEVGFEQPVVIPNGHTAAASVKSLPVSRPRNGRDKSVPCSWKYSQENSKGIEVEASENISTKMKPLSNRFHSPVTQVPRESGPLRKNRKVVTLHPAEKAGSARKDAGPSDVADTLLTAWKTGKFQDDYVTAMKRAKEITSGSSSSGISKIFSDRNYSKPWLSKSPFRRSVDGEVNEVSLKQRSVSANPRANYKSPMNRSRNKPSSSRSSPERMVDDQGQGHRSGSAHPKTRNRSPMSRSHAPTMLSPKRTNWTSQPLWGPESSKSSPVKIRAGRRETPKDPWEGQSLDFVLGSLAEQVRELDERLRSATVSSPALSSSSSLSREVYGNREKHIPDQPNFRVPDKLNYENHGSPSSTSAASSPERSYVQQLNSRGPPARYISRGYTVSQQDIVYKPARRPASTTYMDELKALLKEISSDNASPPRRNHVCSDGRRVESESKPHKVLDIARKTESMHKNGITRPKIEAELESDFTSSTSANTSRPCSVASQRDRRETRQRRSPVVGNGRASSRGRVMHDAFYGNGNGKLQGERERASDPGHERRSAPQENSVREDNGIRRVLKKRLVQRESVYRDVQERPVQIQERFEKRTVEVRSCAPQHVLHNGHTVVREQLVKEVVEAGLPSPEMNGHDSLRRNSDREQKEANGKVTPVKQRRNDEAPQRPLSNGKFAGNRDGERGSAQPRGPASNGPKMTTDRGPTQQMQDQTSEYALSNGGEKLKSRQLESPLWEEGSPHCSASWRKRAVNGDEIEDRMLLSGSVDFSPWNTEKLPDIGTPQAARENRTTRSKSPSPIAEDAAGSPKIQRAKWPPKLNKPFGQRPGRKDAPPNGEVLFIPNAAPVRETKPKSQARPNLKKPKPVPRGIDAIWSLNDDQDVALKPSAVQNGVRKSTPTKKESPAKPKQRTASVPRARLIKEQTSSSEEVPDSTSKSSHDDNCLPVIMAKDPESRQRVIERRKKALQLDMEHRQRLARNSRPTSARSSG